MSNNHSFFSVFLSASERKHECDRKGNSLAANDMVLLLESKFGCLFCSSQECPVGGTYNIVHRCSLYILHLDKCLEKGTFHIWHTPNRYTLVISHSSRIGLVFSSSFWENREIGAKLGCFGGCKIPSNR